MLFISHDTSENNHIDAFRCFIIRIKTNLKPVYFVAKIDKNYVKNAKIVKKLR